MQRGTALSGLKRSWQLLLPRVSGRFNRQSSPLLLYCLPQPNPGWRVFLHNATPPGDTQVKEEAPGMDEAELIERAKTDKEAFGELYELYVARIYNYVYYRTGSVEDAEDLTARIFFKAMQHIGSYHDRGVPFSAWLYRIAHNLVANWHRDRSRRKIISLDDIVQWQAPEKGPEFVTQLMEDKDALLTAIRRLPADRQELLILKFVER
jgi:RNA polymerase sigma-70 factor (ECF subfamily)